MQIVGALAVFVAGANALVFARDTCCFQLTASGSVAGPVGELDDGQVRIGGGLQPVQYCVDSSGSLNDSSGRKCVLTETTTQLLCGAIVNRSATFSVNSSGRLSHDDDSRFVTCGADENGQSSIFASPRNETAATCRNITLIASGGCGQQSTNQSTVPPPPPPPPPQAVSGCPATLAGNFEFPHLIVPVDSSTPDQAYGTSYYGKVTSTVSTIFNFDIPSGDAGRQCSLQFLFPNSEDLTTSSYSFSGDGNVQFGMLRSIATQSTTYNTSPPVSGDYSNITLVPGNSYTITTISCPAGQAIAFEMKSSSGTELNYFQNSGPPPIGLYITVC